MTPQQRFHLLKQSETLFTPRDAIKRPEHLAGRKTQIVRVLRAIESSGAHVIIYGEMGVGKTSVANCIRNLIEGDENDETHVLPLINCDSSDDFASLWRKVFARVLATREFDTLGLGSATSEESWGLDEQLPEDVTPFAVQELLRDCSSEQPVVVVLDEFDRLSTSASAEETTRKLADTMKAISDQGILATIFMVGVGDSVVQLIKGHESIVRHLVEVPMPRMSVEEQWNILEDRLPRLGLQIADGARELVTYISQGLPYYVHLLGLAASQEAIRRGVDTIDHDSVRAAMNSAIDESEQSLKNAYYEATLNPHPNNQYPATLAACAVAPADDFGFFTPKNIAPALSRITGKDQPTGAFAGRLKQLCSETRGRILTVRGERYHRRYRFRDPLMQPFCIIKAIADEVATPEQLTGRA